MARKMSWYSKLLTDPRWQRKRLEVLKRADWKCEACERDDVTLHVHHGYYDKRLKPWEYDSLTLWCLCEDCHAEAESLRLRVYEELAHHNPLGMDDLRLFQILDEGDWEAAEQRGDQQHSFRGVCVAIGLADCLRNAALWLSRHPARVNEQIWLLGLGSTYKFQPSGPTADAFNDPRFLGF